MERLQKILSQAGVASRRASEQLIVDGRVTVNGETVRQLGSKAEPHDDIRVDGRRVKAPGRHRYLLLNKPRGYVTTRSDPEKRPTVIDLLKGIREYVYPVGRLDFDSEGLLILTNDGDLAACLTHPRHAVDRVYEVEVLGTPDAHDLERLARGIVIEGRRTQGAHVRLLHAHGRTPARGESRGRRTAAGRDDDDRPRGQGRGRAAAAPGAARHRETSTIEVTVREGRNRQVRKMCDAIGHPVNRLRRVAIGPIRDGQLKTGYWRELSPAEVKALRKASSSAPATAGT